uniref:Cytochrome b n=1 Tax=Pyemotes zhonghuajia TaxID=2749944 RepID=A0A8T9JDK8_9ACAR|nr:cytochrome b [Pyemotes zhonghuajia]UOK09668.1 cytochrome b [Pyemotes zhonghuajia]
MPNYMSNILFPITKLPTPSTINYNWNLGSLLGFTLMIQLISGILISMHYNSSINEAFDSVIHISRNVNNGWLMRIIHINGASLFFILIYSHMAKNLLLSSFKLNHTWNSGIMILLILMATAFLGYVLPWGQMSFWAATVITNLLSAIPFWGNEIVIWLWGGFSVWSPTLTRFFSLHFLLPFIISALAIVHMISLHSTGSSNPIAIEMNKDKIKFHPYFTSKDLIGLIMMMFLFFMMILHFPYISTDPENFIPANPLITPIHIQPEWYFLFAYAILRSIPNKLGGVIALFLSIMIFLIKPFQMNKKNSFKFNPMKKIMCSLFFHIFIILSWIGMNQVEYPFESIGLIYSILYFLIILMI